MENTVETVRAIFPLMTLRGVVVFPEMVMNLDVERAHSVAAVNAALKGERLILLVTQKDILKENPGEKDIYSVGTVCRVRQFIRLPSGGMRVMFEGFRRAKITTYLTGTDYAEAELSFLTETVHKESSRAEAVRRQVVSLYEQYARIEGSSIPETIASLSVSEPSYTADYVAQNVPFRFESKQKLLEILDPARRMTALRDMLADEVEVNNFQQKMNDDLRERFSGQRREAFMREQMRYIQAELGDDDSGDVEDYLYRIHNNAAIPQPVKDKLVKEAARLSKQPFGSSETTVIRNYLDACLELPWGKKTKERLDISAASRILEADHYGLEKVKKRILEALAVRSLAPENSGSIICLVGPPGVGKTSIAISIAKATNRKLARMSLGGVHDEAEIRGHRKTYVGAMPGRIMSAITQSGSCNPLMLLDEIDKLGSDYRGDPAAALLEALDPEQNSSFRDNFLEIPFDLSDVFFITTANTTDTIPRPLLDRMEVIELSSYTDEEKLVIAKDHLLPKQRKKHGIPSRSLRVSDNAMREIISGWTRESGVRRLEQTLASLCRKTAAEIVMGNVKTMNVKPEMLEDLLGPRRFKLETRSGGVIGVVRGLAWTSVGGEVLDVEAVALEGTGKIELTGNLGDVMRESARAALTYIRSRSRMLGVRRDFYKDTDIHIHFPEGAVPKDGPSAGITITCAIVSALTGATPVGDVAMTGEVTLNGRVLPIGGLREKTMAALRHGAHTVIIPEDNKRDLDEIDPNVRRALNFVTVSHVDEVISTALDFSTAVRAEEKKEAADIEVQPAADTAVRPGREICQ